MEVLKKIMSVFLFVNHLFANTDCTYDYGIYNVNAKKSLKRVKESVLKKNLPKEMMDINGCTICEEDQVRVRLINGVYFKACRLIAKDVEKVLNNSIKNGFVIREVIGYRPQMSRGKLDSFGNRTKLSNHSFGSAIDINPKHNGLYDRCVKWSRGCRLRMGGPWQPETDQLSIPSDGELVKSFQRIGFLWGGRLKGRQKDFMHFSLRGN